MRSVDSKFNSNDDIPNTFSSQTEAEDFKNAFHSHVEVIISGKRPIKSAQNCRCIIKWTSST